MLTRKISSFISEKVKEYKEDYVRAKETSKDVKDMVYQIDMLLMNLCGSVAEEMERQDQEALTGELFPIMDATQEWLRIHHRADEIVFRKDEEDGVEREIPFQAIYNSPIAKAQSVMKLGVK